VAALLGRIAKQQPQLFAVGQQSGPFALGAQHPLGDQAWAEAVSAAPAAGCVEVDAEARGPNAQRGTPIVRGQQPAAVLRSLAGDHGFLPGQMEVAQGFDQRLDDVGQDAPVAALLSQYPELAPVYLPAVIQEARLRADARRQQGAFVEVLPELEFDEGLGQGRPEEAAVAKVEGHRPGVSPVRA
jgi:hypothetical protein